MYRDDDSDLIYFTKFEHQIKLHSTTLNPLNQNCLIFQRIRDKDYL